jgi:indole-3-glycerol phosphate synthase
MTILEKIKQHKLEEIAYKKSLFPVKLLEQQIYFESPCVSLKDYITDPNRSGIIAEFKRKSPSKGIINNYASVEKTTLGYMQAGASALSVLTDESFFGAKKDDLIKARKFNFCPILRKDFILDEYQIIESKSMGADAILLIAKILDSEQLKRLCQFAHQLGLEVLLETHTENEILDHLTTEADLIGINNRNLNTFDVDIETSIELSNLLPSSTIRIAESGIESAETIQILRNNGFHGFLIGEYFMRHSEPEKKCQELIKRLQYAY